ncbi:hypothetical protein Ddc_24661 [Ditylenchus destructor]|nr:hypothetical protein Ddc_24661 [Ditylenchus destructor]
MACGGFIRALATDIPALFPMCWRPWISKARLMANCWWAHHGETGIETATFSDLQQRLNRKTVTAKQCANIRPSSAHTTFCTMARSSRAKICGRYPSRNDERGSLNSSKSSTTPV